MKKLYSILFSTIIFQLVSIPAFAETQSDFKDIFKDGVAVIKYNNEDNTSFEVASSGTNVYSFNKDTKKLNLYANFPYEDFDYAAADIKNEKLFFSSFSNLSYFKHSSLNQENDLSIELKEINLPNNLTGPRGLFYSPRKGVLNILGDFISDNSIFTYNKSKKWNEKNIKDNDRIMLFKPDRVKSGLFKHKNVYYTFGDLGRKSIRGLHRISNNGAILKPLRLKKYIRFNDEAFQVLSLSKNKILAFKNTTFIDSTELKAYVINLKTGRVQVNLLSEFLN